MSKRSKRRREPQAASERAAAPEAAGGASRGRARRGSRLRADAGAGQAADGRSPAPTWSLGVQIAFVVAVFAVVVLVAELAGAANLGVAFGIGQIAFAIAVIYLLVRR